MLIFGFFVCFCLVFFLEKGEGESLLLFYPVLFAYLFPKIAVSFF